MQGLLLNIIIVITILAVLSLLFSNRIRRSPFWRATVTPLASIIGSGFLVVTPLFLLILGKYAFIAIIVMVCIAFAIGYVIQYNIVNIEPACNSQLPWPISRLEEISYLSLSIAYLISVPFYIKLLASFLLRGFNIAHSHVFTSSIATVILAYIGLTGYFKGFTKLEMLTEYSVNIKLSIITATILALVIYNVNLMGIGQWHLTVTTPIIDLDTIRKLLGTIIILQGFETSRYIGLNYNAKTRVKTMQLAQLISGIIYILFVGLAIVVFDTIPSISDTSIIDVSEKLSSILPIILVIAAIMSQFSAAIADTVSMGGLLHEVTAKKFRINYFYLLSTTLAIILTWMTNIFGIIALASRAFALYYAVQSLEALLIANNTKDSVRIVLFGLTFLLMMLVVIFGASV